MSNRSRQLKAFFAAAMLAAALAVTPRAEAVPFDHAPIDSILKEYVSAGRVDYQRLQQNRTALDQYVASLANKRMAAGALFRDEAGGVLLVNPVYKPTWDLPGGAVEAEESPGSCSPTENLPSSRSLPRTRCRRW